MFSLNLLSINIVHRHTYFTFKSKRNLHFSSLWKRLLRWGMLSRDRRIISSIDRTWYHLPLLLSQKARLSRAQEILSPYVGWCFPEIPEWCNVFFVVFLPFRVEQDFSRQMQRLSTSLESWQLAQLLPHSVIITSHATSKQHVRNVRPISH